MPKPALRRRIAAGVAAAVTATTLTLTGAAPAQAAFPLDKIFFIQTYINGDSYCASSRIEVQNIVFARCNSRDRQQWWTHTLAGDVQNEDTGLCLNEFAIADTCRPLQPEQHWRHRNSDGKVHSDPILERRWWVTLRHLDYDGQLATTDVQAQGSAFTITPVLF
ncbi:hypothetical protein [Streptomyces syringium]|uniref:hypothetical protein n=1 Tax=Streptomyces syringium TaxID=76729 RepID=UPI003451F7CB